MGYIVPFTGESVGIEDFCEKIHAAARLAFNIVVESGSRLADNGFFLIVLFIIGVEELLRHVKLSIKLGNNNCRRTLNERQQL